MPSQDRTAEFAAVLRSLRERRSPVTSSDGGVTSLEPRPPAAVLQQHAQFMSIARLIGRDISQTYNKLERLTLLARRRSLFEDRPVEVQQLAGAVRADLAALNRQLGRLQALGGAAAGRHVQTFSGGVLLALQSRLASMSTRLRDALEVRKQNLRRQRRRREQFSGSAVSTSLPESALAGPGSGSGSGSVLLAEEARAREEAVLEMGEPQPQQEMMLMEDQDALYQSRAETMQSIESTVVELGAVFQQLAHMVHQHGEMVQRIDANTEEASVNVEAAHSEILKYFQSVTSNRWLMMKVFGVLIGFFIVFVIFLT